MDERSRGSIQSAGPRGWVVTPSPQPLGESPRYPKLPFHQINFKKSEKGGGVGLGEVGIPVGDNGRGRVAHPEEMASASAVNQVSEKFGAHQKLSGRGLVLFLFGPSPFPPLIPCPPQPHPHSFRQLDAAGGGKFVSKFRNEGTPSSRRSRPIEICRRSVNTNTKKHKLGNLTFNRAAEPIGFTTFLIVKSATRTMQ